MDFLKRNILKTNRNGNVYIGESISMSKVNNAIGNVTGLVGNYLPAVTDDNITYTVPHYVNFQETIEDADGNAVVKNLLEITTDGIKVNGNIIASGEVSAFGAGTSSGGGGSVTIVDNLTSTATDAALSANQGRVLKQLIDNIDVGDIDLSGYLPLNTTNNNILTSSQSGVLNFKSTSSSEVGIRLYFNETNGGGLWYNGAQGMYLYNAASSTQLGLLNDGTPYYQDLTYNKRHLWHSGNFNPSNYLPLSGDTITGTLSIKRDASVIRYYDSAGTLQGWLGFNGVNNPVIFEQDGVTTRQLLHAGNYSNWALPLSGGTLTGSGNDILVINRTNGNPYIRFKNNGEGLAYFGVNTSKEMVFIPQNSTEILKVLHTGNYSDYALPLSGGTLTGSLIMDSSKGYYQDTVGGTILGYSNDSTKVNGAISTGSNFVGSPLHHTVIRSTGTLKHYRGDLLNSYDILDSYNTDYMGNFDIDASALSTSNFYPVIFNQNAKPLVVRMYSLGGNTSVAYNRNDLEFTFRGQGWTDAPHNLTVHNYNCYTATETTIGCIGMGLEGGAKVVWVRGGIKYKIYSNQRPYLKIANYTDGNQIFTVGTSFSGGTNTKVTIYWTPQTTSGLGALYHSSSIAVGSNLSVASNAGIKGTLTTTGLATFSGGLTTTTGTFNRINAASVSWRNNCGALLSTAGWYRFAVATISNNAGGNVILTIRREYYNTDNEAYTLMANIDFGGCNWTQLGGSYRTQLIDKVRCTYNTNGTMYFDFYYNGTVNNGVYVNCIGDAYCQTPTLVTSPLAISNQINLTNGYKMGSKNAYQMTLYRNATNGGSYIMYGANNQLTKSWAAGADSQLRFGWYYKDTSAGTDVEKMWLDSAGNLSSDYWMLHNTVSNPYLKLTHTYSGTTYTHYLQGYNGYLYLGAGSAKSLRIDSNGNCLAVGEVTAHSDKRLKSNIKPLSVRGELNPVTYTKDGKESIGFIADEVKEFYPELVVTDDSTDEKYLSLNYAQLTAVLYAEIKELKKRITQLENK